MASTEYLGSAVTMLPSGDEAADRGQHQPQGAVKPSVGGQGGSDISRNTIFGDGAELRISVLRHYFESGHSKSGCLCIKPSPKGGLVGKNPVCQRSLQTSPNFSWRNRV